MTESQRFDLRRATLDPRSEFGTPENVLEDLRLDWGAKHAVLKIWEQDERQLAVAEDEGLAGGERSMLRRVLRALDIVSERLARSASGTQSGKVATGCQEAADAPSRVPLVKDVMYPLTEVIHVDHDLREAYVRMRNFQVPCMPVADGDEIVGILQARDIYREFPAADEDISKTRVGDYLSKGIAYSYMDDDVEVAQTVMDRSGHHHLLVIDHERYLQGFITLEVTTSALRLCGPRQPSAADPGPEGRVVKKAGRATGEHPGRPWLYSVQPKIRK